MGIFRKSYCYCGSGREAGFCSHKAATKAGTVRNGARMQPVPRAKGKRK